MSDTCIQPRYKRQRFLLAFIRQLEADGVIDSDLQTLVFLHTMSGGSNYYEFVPHDRGPHSFQLAEDLFTLLTDGFVIYRCVPDGIKIQLVETHPTETAFQIAAERGYSLCRKVFREYPYYSIRSALP